MRRNSASAVILTGVVVTALSACGGSSDETLPTAGTAAATTVTATTLATATTRPAAAAPAAATTVAATTAATTTATTTPTTAATTTTLPGEQIDFGFWPAGARLDVAGVAFDETLSVHELPGRDQPVVASLPPLTRGVVSMGNVRQLGAPSDGIWLEVTVGDVTGWVTPNRLVYLGAPRDVTADVLAAAGGTPTAASMLDLGQVATDALVPSDPDSLPTIVVAAAPGDGPSSEVVYDTFPGEAFGDDSSLGSRLVVTGRQVPTGSLPSTGVVSPVEYELVGVTAINLCSRGVTEDGLCV